MNEWKKNLISGINLIKNCLFIAFHPNNEWDMLKILVHLLGMGMRSGSEWRWWMFSFCLDGGLTQTQTPVSQWALPSSHPLATSNLVYPPWKHSFKIRPTTRIPQTNALYTQFPLISTQFWFVFAKRWARKEKEHSCVLKHIKEWFKW